MTEFLIVLAIAMLPVVGNLAGAGLAELTRPPEELVGSALHAAAGVAVALVAVELMPRVLGTTPPWLIAGAFLAGAALSVVLAQGARLLCKVVGGGSAGAWMVYVAIAADLLSDGLMTGAGGAVSSLLGLLLGLSQVVANVPGGFAANANFRSQGVARGKRLAIALAAPLPVIVGASLGFLLLRGRSEVVQNGALAFIIGVLLLATVEDTLPQGDKPEPRRMASTGAFAGGFALFTLLATALD